MKQKEKNMKTYKGAGIALFKKTSDGYSVLLGKRTIKPNKGKWSIFGGRTESYDNTPFETAKREFREESYIDLDSLNAKLIGTCKFNLFVFKWSTFLYIVDESFSPPTRFCSEFSEFRFIKLTEIKNYKLGFGVKKEIREFLKLVNN